MNIKSNLSNEIIIKSSGYIISSNGFYVKQGQGYENDTPFSCVDLSENIVNLRCFLCERKQNILYIFNVNIMKKEETVIFDKELILTLQFNFEYHELDVIKDDNFYRIEGLTDLSLHYENLFKYIRNQDILINFFTDILKEESYFKEVFQEKGIGKMHPAKLFYFFARKFNKYVDYLLKTNRENIISMLFEIGYSESERDNIDFTINKNSFIIMDNLSKYDISLFTAIKLSKKSFSDFNKLYSVLEKLNIGSIKLWNAIAEIDYLSLEQIGSFLIKSIFKNNCMTSRLNYSGTYNSKINNEILEDYILLYIDYLNMINIDVDELFPDDLSSAHDNAISNIKYKEVAKYHNDFRRIITEEEYQSLVFIPDNSDLKVVAPEKVEDLIIEGEEQHNCVGSYIDSVINRRCKIYFIRKNNKAYITAEVRGKHIFQVKRTFNKSPNEEDFVFIRLWANEKNLTF